MVFFLPLIASSPNLNRLERVEFSAEQIINQVHQLQNRDQPIEILQFPPIQITIRQPIRPIASRRELVHKRHQKRARVTPGGDRQPEQRRRGAPHTLRRLVVEKLQMPNRHKRLCYSVETVLRQQSENRDRNDRPRLIHQAVGGSGLLPLDLDESGGECGE